MGGVNHSHQPEPCCSFWTASPFLPWCHRKSLRRVSTGTAVTVDQELLSSPERVRPSKVARKAHGLPYPPHWSEELDAASGHPPLPSPPPSRTVQPRSSTRVNWPIGPPILRRVVCETMRVPMVQGFCSGIMFERQVHSKRAARMNEC